MPRCNGIDPRFSGKPLIAWFAGVERGTTLLGVAVKIMSGADVARCFAAGIDFALIGRGAILHHDFVRQVRADPNFEPISRPVAPAHLEAEGLSVALIDYMRNWRGFVAARADLRFRRVWRNRASKHLANGHPFAFTGSPSAITI